MGTTKCSKEEVLKGKQLGCCWFTYLNHSPPLLPSPPVSSSSPAKINTTY